MTSVAQETFVRNHGILGLLPRITNEVPADPNAIEFEQRVFLNTPAEDDRVPSEAPTLGPDHSGPLPPLTCSYAELTAVQAAYYRSWESDIGDRFAEMFEAEGRDIAFFGARTPTELAERKAAQEDCYAAMRGGIL